MEPELPENTKESPVELFWFWWQAKQVGSMESIKSTSKIQMDYWRDILKIIVVVIRSKISWIESIAMFPDSKVARHICQQIFATNLFFLEHKKTNT